MSADDHVEATPISRVFARYAPGEGQSLGEMSVSLLEEQKSAWADCRRGFEGLALAREREVRCDGFSVLLQHNPGRAVSIEARVARGDVARRPCFLCIDKLPPDQRMITYGGGYVVLCNPMPILSSHFTVPHRCHRPQAIKGNAEVLTQLVDDFGEGWTILYNGPRCGASAPDHLHFQVVTGGRMPIEKEIAGPHRLALRRETDGVRVSSGERLGRAVAVLEAAHSHDLVIPLSSLLHGLAGVAHAPECSRGRRDVDTDEPLVNIAAFRRAGKTYLVAFPRRAHRPAAFFLSGDGRIAVSPAAAEMGGIIVTPEGRDFDRLTPAMVEEIYREVSVDGSVLEQVIETV